MVVRHPSTAAEIGSGSSSSTTSCVSSREEVTLVVVAMNADMRGNDFQHISRSSYSWRKFITILPTVSSKCVIQYGINALFFWCVAIFARGQAICHTQIHTECSLRLPWLILTMCHPSYDHALCFCPRGIRQQPNLRLMHYSKLSALVLGESAPTVV